jgi:hypothetical protein
MYFITFLLVLSILALICALSWASRSTRRVLYIPTEQF